jgi:hypothetical protein
MTKAKEVKPADLDKLGWTFSVFSSGDGTVTATKRVDEQLVEVVGVGEDGARELAAQYENTGVRASTIPRRKSG